MLLLSSSPKGNQEKNQDLRESYRAGRCIVPYVCLFQKPLEKCLSLFLPCLNTASRTVYDAETKVTYNYPIHFCMKIPKAM